MAQRIEGAAVFLGLLLAAQQVELSEIWEGHTDAEAYDASWSA